MHNYNELSDSQLSLKVYRLINPSIFEGDIEVTEGSEHGIAVWNKGEKGPKGFRGSFNIKNWNDIMPILHENMMSLEPHAEEDFYFCATRYMETKHKDKSPQRAIAICYLKMMAK